MSFSKTQQVNLPLASLLSHYPFNAECQIGKLWIPTFNKMSFGLTWWANQT